MVEITQRPQKIIDDAGIVSKWNAIWHPCIFKFQRKDWNIATIIENFHTGEGPLYITLDLTVDQLANEYPLLNPGDKIYLNSGPYVGIYTVSDRYTESSQPRLIIDSPFISNTSSGYINVPTIRTDHSIEIKILEYTSGVSQDFSSEYSKFRANKEGIITADLQSTLQSMISAVPDFNYDVVNKRAPNLGQPFNIVWREYYLGFYRDVDGNIDDSFTTENSDNLHFIANAVKQMGDRWGQNVGEFFPYLKLNVGTNFIVNGNFDTNLNGWTNDAGWSWNNGKAELNTDLDTADDLTQTINTTTNIGDKILVKFDISGYEKGVLLYEFDRIASTATSLNITSNGTYSFIYDILSTNEVFNIHFIEQSSITDANGTKVFLDNVSISKISYIDNTTAKFLTKFQQPKRFLGYPFDLSFIYSKELSGIALHKAEEGLDASFEQFLDSDIPLIRDDGGSPEIDNFGYINRMKLEEGYGATIKYIRTYLRDDDHDLQVSEFKIIELDNECKTNPVYLMWLNPCGGYDYWLFDTAQNITDNVSQEKTFEKYVEDLANSNARMQTQSKNSQEEIQLGASNLTAQQAEGLRHILASPFVQRYIGLDEDTGFPKWQVVRIQEGGYLILDTYENKSEISFTIYPPQKFIQQQ